MRKRISGVIALGLAIIGLGASIASLVDYFGPTFCAETGCATVRASAWAHPLGVPMPVFGIAYFAAMIALAVWSRPRMRPVRIGLAIAGGAWAVGLIALQAFAIGAWCKLCMIADPTAIALAVAVIADAGTVRITWRRGALALPAAFAIVIALLAWVHVDAPTVAPGTPALVAREQVTGAVTVVDFVDFECPFCRKFQPSLVAAVAEAKTRVHMVRKMVPLPQHKHALLAALAWCCADAQGRGDAMADALFAADPGELTPDGCERIAAKVGCDLERYRRDYPATFGRVAADMLDARDAGVHSLPTIFIGSQQLVGANHSPTELAAAFAHAP